ncbi:hypothetical protein FRC17_000415, partial [Serendipita sp. 399]
MLVRFPQAGVREKRSPVKSKKERPPATRIESITCRTTTIEKDAGTKRRRRIATSDHFAVLSLLGLVIVSIITIGLTFTAERGDSLYPFSDLSPLQIVIAAVTLPVTSTVLRIIGKRYVYARLCGNGLRSRQVANLNDWSVSQALDQMAALRFDLLGILLLVVWLLALATGLTVRHSEKPIPIVLPRQLVYLNTGTGSLDAPGTVRLSSLALSTSDRIFSFVSAFEARSEGSFGYINMTNAYAGRVYYPPLPKLSGKFVAPASLNGLKVEVSHLQALPSSAFKLDCSGEYQPSGSLWLLRATQTMLSFVYSSQAAPGRCIQVNSTAVMLGGRLSVDRIGSRPYARFEANGSTWPMEMSDDQWAFGLMDVVCSSLRTHTEYFFNHTLESFGVGINQRDMFPADPEVISDEKIWSTVMGTVVGAYSDSIYGYGVGNARPAITVDLTISNDGSAPEWGIYILIANTVVSILLLYVVWGLLEASPLDQDFLDSTRLLLGPLDDTQLFNATLDETIRNLNDPYLQVLYPRHLLVKTSKDDVEHLLPPFIPDLRLGG